MVQNLVSIIMSCYNEEIEWINQCIQSLLNQTYKNLEIVIVNDNPKNIEISKVLNCYLNLDSRIKVIINPNNLGLVKSLNEAIMESNGEYIARIDSDDISELSRIETQVNYLINNKDVDFVMSHANIINESGFKVGEYTVTPNKMKDIKLLLKYKNVSIHPTWMFRRKILIKLKGYNEIAYVEDYEFLCRAILEGYNIESIPLKLIDYRIRSTSVCNSNRIQQQINFQNVNIMYKENLKKKNIDSSMKYNNLTINTKYANRNNSKKNFLGCLLLLRNKYKRIQLSNEIAYRMNLIRLKLQNLK